MKHLILGIDPGSRHTGYGVIAVEGDGLEHIAHGVIDLKASWSMHERLRVLHLELQKVFDQHKIRETAVEKIFFGKNADSAFKLGHARGVALLAVALNGSTLAEYAARFVKKCITGTGAADKEHVQRMIFSQLRLQPKELAFDASDALSLAVTHARMRDVNDRLKQMLEGSP